MGEDLLLLAVYTPPAVSASAVPQMRRFFLAHRETIVATRLASHLPS